MSWLPCICSFNEFWIGKFGAMRTSLRSFVEVLKASFHQFLPNYLESCRLKSNKDFS